MLRQEITFPIWQGRVHVIRDFPQYLKMWTLILIELATEVAKSLS